MAEKFNNQLVEQLKLLAPESLLGTQLYLGPLLLHQSQEGNAEKIKKLVGKGAPFYVDWDGSSCLHWAAHHNLADVAELLLRCGISATTYNKVARTALHVAAQNGSYEITRLLLACKSDPNAKDLLLMTPLHWACMSGNTDLVLLLLDHGALMSIRNRFGKLPAEIAEEYSHHKIVNLLQEMRGLPSSEKTDRLLKARKETTSLAQALRLNLPISSSQSDVLKYVEERKSLLGDKQELVSKNRKWNAISNSERQYAKFMANQINRYVSEENDDNFLKPSDVPKTEILKRTEKRKGFIRHNVDIIVKKIKGDGTHKVEAIINTEKACRQNMIVKIPKHVNDEKADYSSKHTDISNGEKLKVVDGNNDLYLHNDEKMKGDENGKMLESNMNHHLMQNMIDKKPEDVHDENADYFSKHTNVPNEEKLKFVEERNKLDIRNDERMKEDENRKMMGISNIENHKENIIDMIDLTEDDENADCSSNHSNVPNEEAGKLEVNSSKPTLSVAKSPSQLIQIAKISGNSSTSAFKHLSGKKIIQIKAEDLIYMTKEKKVVIKTTPASSPDVFFDGKQYSNQEELVSAVQTKISNIQKQVETLRILHRQKLLEAAELLRFYNTVEANDIGPCNDK